MESIDIHLKGKGYSGDLHLNLESDELISRYLEDPSGYRHRIKSCVDGCVTPNESPLDYIMISVHSDDAI